jgi:ankyrin repeat protein
VASVAVTGRSVSGALLAYLLVVATACGSNGASTVFSDRSVVAVADAAAAGDASRVAELVRDGTDPSATGRRGVSLLQWALLHRSKTGVESLLTAGADPAHTDADGASALQYAAMADDPAYLDILLAHNADVNEPNALDGRTPLMDALMAGRDVQFASLLHAGARLDLADRAGDTVLHLAAQTNSFRAALTLLAAGANPAARNHQGVTFQRYLSMTPANVLTAEARSDRDAIATWLRDHGE